MVFWRSKRNIWNRMKRRLWRIIPCVAWLIGGCAWIDDIGTVDTSGSYTFTPSFETTEDPKGSERVTQDSMECIGDHTSKDFDIFDVQSIDDTMWQIIMYDQVRQRESATILGITFAPWSASDPTVSCPPPEDLVGSSAEVTIDGCIRATLALGVCKPQQTYQITGTLTLDAFSTTRRETVSGTLDGKLWLVRYVETSEGRTMAATELGDFSSSFQFPVHVGTPWYR